MVAIPVFSLFRVVSDPKSFHTIEPLTPAEEDGSWAPLSMISIRGSIGEGVVMEADVFELN